MNILIFSNQYPFKDKEIAVTKAVHYFAKEWVALGHNVVVVHNHINLVNPFSTSKMKSHMYTMDGVKIVYTPIKRYIPKSDYIFKNELRGAKEKILRALESVTFIPDYFIVHFCAEQWQIVEEMREYIPCRPIPVFHNCDVKSIKRIEKISATVEKVGYRSKKILNKLEQNINSKIITFPVYSGAPDYIFDIESRNQNTDIGIRTLLYAGNLIPLKKIDLTLKALAHLKSDYDFKFRIIGSGHSEEDLKKIVNELGLCNYVEFMPRMERSKVLEYMSHSDCFIMVSKPETYGIVYIEAMASGCFVIGSKGEGIDGVIIDKKNGLLIEPDNVDDLKKGLEYFFGLTDKELNQYKNKAKVRASEFKESTVAKNYLDNIKK